MSHNVSCTAFKKALETDKKRIRTHKDVFVTSTDALFFFTLDRKKRGVYRGVQVLLVHLNLLYIYIFILL